MSSGAEPERALFLRRVVEPLPTGFSRLYCGSEFCCWTFPPLAQLRQALAAARQACWAFTLVTPVVSEPFLPLLQETLAALLPQLSAGDELVVSDWGTLALARGIEPELPMVLGRTLSGQKRGPQIVTLDLSPDQLAYFRQGSWYSLEAQALLSEMGIARVELDNLVQGLAPLPQGLTGSLHYPYAMVTSSRNCPFSPHSAGGCSGPCGEVFTLASPQSPLPLYQGGNSQFLLNAQVPAPLAPLGINRLVFHPQLPR